MPRGARYHLVTDLSLTAAPARVWQTLVEVELWPSWWGWLRQVRVLRPPGPDGRGGRFRGLVATPGRYRLRCEIEVVEVDPNRRIVIDATGDLVGRGEFALSETAEGGTRVEFVWRVRTRRLWMTLASPIARRRFVRNHHRLMADFAGGLAYGTGSGLRGVSHHSLSPGRVGLSG